MKNERFKSMAILELKDVCYSYTSEGETKKVLKEVCAQFEQGMLYAIIGKSGSGKSTLLSLMAGLDLPDSGSVLYEGKSTHTLNLDDYRRHCAAVIYQNFCLFPLLTAQENIMYPMELCHVKKEDALRESKALAEKVSLPLNLLDRYPSKISGGEQQRVAIARALAMGRKLLLADEPTGNLDGENSENIINLLADLAHHESRCVIIVTHDIAVMQKADVVLAMTDGKLQSFDKKLL